MIDELEWNVIELKKVPTASIHSGFLRKSLGHYRIDEEINKSTTYNLPKENKFLCIGSR